jgi:acyl transferase domain-containing protein/3-hydroxymyristoyl/3-hydroxydecanoyl-(acyl carrier protein) dehydratase
VDNIAIVGMGCLFPDYADKEKFWNTLIKGERFIYQQNFQGRIVERSGLLRSGADFFTGRLADEELQELDVFSDLFKWVAYITDEALRESGYAEDTARLQRTGMIFGCLAQPSKDQADAMYPFVVATINKEVNTILGEDCFRYQVEHKDIKIQSLLTDTEPVRYIAEKRGLGGPVIMFNAACATPLYALKLAAIYLNAGEADMIIAGSHCLNESNAAACGLFDTFGILSGINECRPLDKGSKGVITSSGAGAFVLKRLADAERDGDRILAVIENIGLSNDGGSGSGIISPSIEGQLKLYESTYANGISRRIDYIECHATGTEAGDRAEIESIEQFFGAGLSTGDCIIKPSKDEYGHAFAGRPLIGALKGSTGHFLSATACASVAKVVMALSEGVIPASFGVRDPICEGIVRENTPWKAKPNGVPRRAGINAFGFGGINAHLIIREYIVDTKATKAARQSPIPLKPPAGLAIVGMGLNIGGFHSVEDFLKGLANSKTGFTAPKPERFREFHLDKAYLDSIGIDEMPKGSYLNSVEFDTMRFKMPVNGDPYFLRRDMLLLETANEALEDAGIKEDASPRTAVIIHSALDSSDQLFMASLELEDSIISNLAKSCPQLTGAQREEVMRILREDENTRENPDNVPGTITSIRGNRISAHWGFTGPSFTVFERETSIFRCIELARFFITEGLADQAVIGVVSLCGELENLYIQKGLGMMGLMSELGIAEGAAVLVLKPMDLAQADGSRIYAEVGGVAVSGVLRNTDKNIGDTIEKVLKQTQVGMGEIRAVEIPKSYDPGYSALIEEVCHEKFGGYLAPESFNTLNIEDYLGFGFSLSAAASIVRHALQLYLSRIFIFGERADNHCHWDLCGKKRVSLVTGYTHEGQFGCAALSECRNFKEAGKKLTSRLVMLPIRFGLLDELKQKLQSLESQMAKEGFRNLYKRIWAEFTDDSQWERGDKHAAVLLCHSKESLRVEIEGLRESVAKLNDPDYAYESPRGSYCSTSPELDLAEISFAEFGLDTYPDGIADDFGLPPDIAPLIGLGDAALRFWPKNHLLKLGAKLISHGIPFDHDKFSNIFDFYILSRPSHILEISTGLPGLLTRLGSPKNRERIANNAAQSTEQQEIQVAEQPVMPDSGVCNEENIWKNELAIIGMGFYAAEFDSVKSFLNGLMTSKKAFQTDTDINGKYLTNSDALIEKTLAEALTDSGLSQEELKDTAFVLFNEALPEKTVFVSGGAAAQAAGSFGIGGPAYTLCSGASPLFRGLALAEYLIEKALATTVCLCIAPAVHDPDNEAEGLLAAEGAAVFVLRKKSKALANHNKIYACISAVTIAEQAGIVKGLCKALEIGHVGHNELRVADIQGSGCDEFSETFNRMLGEQFCDYLDESNFTITDTGRWFGRKLAILSAASLIKHALQLAFFHVFIYEHNSEPGPGLFDKLEKSLWSAKGEKRVSLIAHITEEVCDYAAFAVLTECLDTLEENTQCLSNLALLPIACTGLDDLRNSLVDLLKAAASPDMAADAGLQAVWKNAWREYRAIESPAYTAVLLFDSRKSLEEEIIAMLAAAEGLSDGNRFVSGKRYESKRGSFFTADPIGKEAKIAFMNPPGTMQHFLLFFQMLMMFPRYRHEYLAYLNGEMQRGMDEIDLRYRCSGMEMGMIGIVNMAARDVFGLSPDILTGASLGEFASLFSYDCLHYGINDDPIGSMTALMAAFLAVYTYSAEKISPMFCKGPLEEVKRVAAKEPGVYVSVTASPNSSFIAGTQEAVDRVIKEGGFLAWRLTDNLSIHTPIVDHLYDTVYEAALKCNISIRSDVDFEVFSTHFKKTIGHTKEDFSEYVASILIKRCDFYGLLEAVYKKGGRVFIDMGTGGTCYDWASETFEGRNVFVLSIYPPFLDPVSNMFKTFAKLLSNHINFNNEAITNAFAHPFMEGGINECRPPGEPDNTAAVIEATPLAPNDAFAGHSPRVAGFIRQGLKNNLNAYEKYLENERLLLDWLIRTNTRRVVWDYEQILEITAGSPSKVWGKKYEALDSLAKRARVPLPPFLFFNRVVGIGAEFGQLKPSWIEVETDINDDSILLISKNIITPIILAESSHAAILLLSYIGIDIIYGEGAGYRILNTQEEYYNDLPVRGDTLRSRLEFTDFVKSGSVTLVKSNYSCYKGNKLILTLKLLGGFFTERDLVDANGILSKKKSELTPQMPPLPKYKPLVQPVKDLAGLADGKYGPLLFPTRTSTEAERFYINPMIRMLDRIISMDLSGGDYGLGMIIAEKDIDENHWTFKVHFKNDPVFPGTLLAETTCQIQFLFAIYTGYIKGDRKYFLPSNKRAPIKSTFRGEIKPVASTIRFIQHIKEITETDNEVFLAADCDVYWQGKHVARMEDYCLIIEEIGGKPD